MSPTHDFEVHVDPDLCVGTGECVRIAGAAFVLDDDERIARVLPTFPTCDLEDLEDAAAACPTQAIRIV